MIHKGTPYPNCRYVGKADCGRTGVFVTQKLPVIQCKKCGGK